MIAAILTRRLFLQAMPLAGAAVALPAMAAVSATITENPALLALGPCLDEAVSQYELAAAEKAAALARYCSTAPVVPAVLLAEPNMAKRGPYPLMTCAERERDAEGSIIGSRWIYHADGLAELVAKVSGRSSYGRWLRLRLNAAKRYEADIEAAKITSGLANALEGFYWAADAIRRVTNRVAEQRATTMAGIAIKAKGVAHSPKGNNDGANHRHGGDLADNLLAVLAEAVQL